MYIYIHIYIYTYIYIYIYTYIYGHVPFALVAVAKSVGGPQTLCVFGSLTSLQSLSSASPWRVEEQAIPWES